MTTQVIVIANGPGKFELMTSLFVWKPEKPTVQFVDERGQTYTASINGCEAEDGSGESWNLIGYVKVPFAGDSKHPGAVVLKHCRFKAYFRTDRRQGRLEFYVE